MSSRVLIVPTGDVPDEALESLLRALARAAKGCRFSVATADPSRLLARFGDRFQIWPVRARLAPLARRLLEVDLLVSVAAPEEDVRALGRLAVLSILARHRAKPAVAIDWPGDRPSGLGGALARRIGLACAEIHPVGAPAPAVAASIAERLPPAAT